MFRNFLLYVQIRPHGVKLLTSSARFWFRSVAVLILAMATAESVAWSYLGYLFSTGMARWFTAAFAGLMMFVVIWIVDTSLVTLDRAWAQHAKTILGENVPSSSKTVAGDIFRFGLRIALLVASLTVTSPYLAQVVFHKDIESALDQTAVQSLDAARVALTAKYDAQLSGLEQASAAKRLAYENEVAGKGQSGRYGTGPASQALLNSVKELEGKAGRVQREKDEALGTFNNLAQTWQSHRDELTALYGVHLPQTSILENRRVLDELRKRPENQATELAVKVFLGIVFSGLLLLKLFEPSSVRLYLSEVLQQEYERYLAGAFDPMLEDFERSTSRRAAMTPQRLYDFLTRIWVPANAHPRSVQATKSLAILENMRVKINNEVERANQEVREVCEAANDADQSLVELKSAITSVTADLFHYRKELETVRANGVLDEQARFEYETKLREKIAKADRTLREFQDAIPVETEKRRRAFETVNQVEQRLRERQSELVKTQEKITEVRAHLSSFVRNAAGAAIGMGR